MPRCTLRRNCGTCSCGTARGSVRCARSRRATSATRRCFCGPAPRMMKWMAGPSRRIFRRRPAASQRHWQNPSIPEWMQTKASGGTCGQGLEISTRAAGVEQLDVAGVGDDADPCRVDPFFDQFVANAVGDREQPLRLAIEERLQPISRADQEFALDSGPRPPRSQATNRATPEQTGPAANGSAGIRECRWSTEWR